VQRAKQGHRHVILFSLAGSDRQPKREAEGKCFARALDGTVPITRNTPGTTVAVAIDDDRKPAGTCLLASNFVSSSFSRQDAWVDRCGWLMPCGLADGAACVCMVQLASAYCSRSVSWLLTDDSVALQIHVKYSKLGSTIWLFGSQT
jgi:hypothetical protein